MRCPPPPNIAARAHREFDAILSQDRQLSTAETLAALQADPSLLAVLISSRIKLGAEDIRALPDRRIGQAVAQRARGFGIRILYHNRRRLPAELEMDGQYFQNLHDMLPHCQILSLHALGGPDTDGFINTDTLSIAALCSGRLAAAGLDVFHSEPDYDLRLRDLPNIFMTPHMGSATVETRDARGHRSLDNVCTVFADRPLPDRVD